MLHIVGTYEKAELEEGEVYEVGESYKRFVRKRALVKYQSQSEVIKVML